MLRLFVDNLLPVFLVTGAGYAIAARWNVDPRGVSQVAFYVFAPCLIFDLIIGSDIGGMDALRMIALATVGLLITGALAGAVGLGLGWSRPTVIAVALAALLPNAGNFGLSAVLFAFGDEALAHATVYFVTSFVLTFTVGVFVASLGTTTVAGSLAGLLRVPAIWAVAAAMLVRGTGSSVPTPLARSVELLADASIPTFLVLLGIQLRGCGVRGPFAPLLTSSAARLLGGAATGVLLVSPLGLDGPAASAAVMQSAMPSAVITIVIATQYDVEPKLVTSIVFLTTLLCPLTLTPILAWLGG